MIDAMTWIEYGLMTCVAALSAGALVKLLDRKRGA
jgi:hypothetical protein